LCRGEYSGGGKKLILPEDKFIALPEYEEFPKLYQVIEGKRQK